MEGSVSGSTSAPIYSFGTTPSVHDVSSLAHVTSGSGIADNDADERTSNGGAFKTTSPESVAQQPLQIQTGPGVLSHSCGANARAHQGRVADASSHEREYERTAGDLFRAEAPLEAKPSSDDVRVKASPKHDDSHVPRVELSDEAAKAIKDEMEALQLDEDKWSPASSSQIKLVNKLVYLANTRPDLTMRRADYGVQASPVFGFYQHMKVTMFDN